MADLIERKAAIDGLDGHRDERRHLNDWQVGWNEALDWVQDIYLEDLPSAQPEQRWIPISERLPKEDTDVMIAYRYKAGEGDTSYCDIDITSYGQAYFGGRACSFKEWRAPFEYFHSNYEVVAWMPLPEPYKEEQDGNSNLDNSNLRGDKSGSESGTDHDA